MKKKFPPTDIFSVSANDLLSELYLSEKFTILVESHKDEIIFRKFFDTEKCRFYPQNGKYKLLELLAKVKANNIDDKVIGIIDADFRRILNTITEYENLFLTDKHDVELMMMFSEAWQNMINSFVKPENVAKLEREKQDSLLNILLLAVFPLSCLRWLKEKHELSIQFRRSTGKDITYLKYKDFVDEKDLKIDTKALFHAVESISNQAYFFTKNPHYVEHWEIHKTQIWDLGEFSNGHDVLHILSISLQKLLSNRANTEKISIERLADSLAIAYRFTDFQQTELYQNLLFWQNQRALSILSNI